MSAWKVVDQLVRLVKEGRVDDSVLGEMLTASNVRLTCGSRVGIYSDGMLETDNGIKYTLDPGRVSKFEVCKPEPEPVPEPPKTYTSMPKAKTTFSPSVDASVEPTDASDD